MVCILTAAATCVSLLPLPAFAQSTDATTVISVSTVTEQQNSEDSIVVSSPVPDVPVVTERIDNTPAGRGVDDSSNISAALMIAAAAAAGVSCIGIGIAVATKRGGKAWLPVSFGLILSASCLMASSAFNNFSEENIDKGEQKPTGSYEVAVCPSIDITNVKTGTMNEFVPCAIRVTGDYSGSVTVTAKSMKLESGMSSLFLYATPVKEASSITFTPSDIANKTEKTFLVDITGDATDQALWSGKMTFLVQDNVSRSEGEWVTESNGALHWYRKGILATSREIRDPVTGLWYCLDQDGDLAKGLTRLPGSNDDWAYYDPDTGAKVFGEVFVDSGDEREGWYYFNLKTGLLTRGFVVLPDGTTFYYSPETGQKLFGRTFVDEVGDWRYFDTETGAMVRNRIVAVNGQEDYQVYYDQDGAMVYGQNSHVSDIDGQMHSWYFDPQTGKMMRGLTTLVDENGVRRVVFYDEKTGWMVHGWHEVSGINVHFNEETGEMDGSEVIDIALSKLGAPYLHKDEGGPGMGPDEFVCDSFTSWVYQQVGYDLFESWADTTFYAQYKWLNERGKIVVDPEDLKLGDILFFGNSWTDMRHAGIFYGKDDNGNYQMIHCAGTPLPGGGREGVAIGGLDWDYLGGGSPL